MFDLGQRVVLVMDLDGINRGTVATLENIIDKIGLIRYNEEEKFSGVPLDLLRPATKEEIDKTSYNKLITKQLLPGCKWRSHIKLSKEAKKGNVFTILEISLQSNKKNDLVTILSETDDIPIVLLATALQSYFIYYNPFFENSLAEEMSNSGESIFFRSGQRIICNGKIANIIEVNEETKEAKICFDLTNFSMHNTNLINMKNVKTEDLANIDYKKLIDKKLHIGNKLRAKKELPLSEYGDKEIVESIKIDEEISILSINKMTAYVLEDSFIVLYKDLKIELTTYDILINFIQI